MDRLLHTQSTQAPVPAFVVPAPRACDAIGTALRNAFKGDRTLPDEIAAALLKLDCLA